MNRNKIVCNYPGKIYKQSYLRTTSLCICVYIFNKHEMRYICISDYIVKGLWGIKIVAWKQVA